MLYFTVENNKGQSGGMMNCSFKESLKVRGPFFQTLCIEKDSYMDAI